MITREERAGKSAEVSRECKKEKKARNLRVTNRTRVEHPSLSEKVVQS